MALFDNGIAGLARELGKPRASVGDAGDEYRKPLNPSSFDEFGATLIEGEQIELARLRSPAGIKRQWGFGSAEFEANQAYFYGQLYNSGDGTADSEEQIHGEVTYMWEGATGRESQVVEELDTRDMDTTNRYDRDEQIPVPEQSNKEYAQQDEYLVVKFKPTTPAADIVNDYAISADFSDVRWVTTEYDTSRNRR